MADLIVSTKYESEKVLMAYSDERQQLAFTIESSPDSTKSWRITNYSLVIDESEFETGINDDFYISENVSISRDVSPSAISEVTISRLIIPNELSELMLLNGLRTVPVSVVLRYRENINGAALRTQKFQLDNVVILGHKYSPQIPVFSVSRTDGGSPSDEGEDATVKMQLSYAPETMTQLMALRLHYAEGRDATLADEYLVLDSRITTDEISFVLGDKFSNSVDWGFLLYFGDKYENITASSNIFKAFANMHLSGAANGGVCFGGFSKSTYEQPMFECYYPAYFYGGIVQGGGGGDYPAPGVEEDTGMKWIDGKPIYRKILQVTGTNKAGESLSVPLGSFKLGFLIRLDGGFFTGEDFCCFATAHNSAITANVYTRIRYATTAPEIRIVCGSARSIGSGYAIVEYTKAD